MVKPLLLVDVDGVINVFDIVAFHLENEQDDSIEFEKEFDANGFRIRVPTGIHDRFISLQEHFECVWATTWEDDAPKLLSPTIGFGLEWPIIKFWTGRVANHRTWKLPSIKSWCEDNADGRRVAWIDDDLHEDAERWAIERGDTILISTHHRKGFTQSLFNKLMEWHGNS